MFAKGGDTKVEGIFSGPGHALYAAMDFYYRRVLYSKMKDGRLWLEKEDDDEIMTF